MDTNNDDFAFEGHAPKPITSSLKRATDGKAPAKRKRGKHVTTKHAPSPTTSHNFLNFLGDTTSRTHTPQDASDTSLTANCSKIRILKVARFSFSPCATFVGAAASRSAKLDAEFKALQKGLSGESNIYVRVDERRLDVIKVLIIGKQATSAFNVLDDREQLATPYENGCFVFDIHLGPNYPTEPPLVKLVTTGKGKVSFHPNLAADGKVGLSLLRPWQMPPLIKTKDGWSSSTIILDLVLTLQGHIFDHDRPFFISRGRKFTKETTLENETASVKYNTQVRAATLVHAILPALKGAGNDAVFGQTIR